MTRLAVPPHAHPLDSAAAGCSAVGGRREVFRLGIEISAWVNSSSPGQAHGPMLAPASVMSKTQASRWSRFGTFGLELKTRPLFRCAIWSSGCRRMGRGWAGSLRARERRRACDEHCAAHPPIQPLGIAGASASRPLRRSRLLY